MKFVTVFGSVTKTGLWVPVWLGDGVFGLAPPPESIEAHHATDQKDSDCDAAGPNTIETNVSKITTNKMMTTFKIHLTRIAVGRMLLHLGCLLRGGRRGFHWAGIRRELTKLI